MCANTRHVQRHCTLRASWATQNRCARRAKPSTRHFRAGRREWLGSTTQNSTRVCGVRGGAGAPTRQGMPACMRRTFLVSFHRRVPACIAARVREAWAACCGQGACGRTFDGKTCDRSCQRGQPGPIFLLACLRRGGRDRGIRSACMHAVGAAQVLATQRRAAKRRGHSKAASCAANILVVAPFPAEGCRCRCLWKAEREALACWAVKAACGQFCGALIHAPQLRGPGQGERERGGGGVIEACIVACTSSTGAWRGSWEGAEAEAPLNRCGMVRQQLPALPAMVAAAMAMHILLPNGCACLTGPP